MLKKKKCATKRGKWAMEYNVKVSVKPIKRRKKGAWGVAKKCKCGVSIRGNGDYCSSCTRKLKAQWKRGLTGWAKTTKWAKRGD